jgi:hypothetical protein
MFVYLLKKKFIYVLLGKIRQSEQSISELFTQSIPQFKILLFVWQYFSFLIFVFLKYFSTNIALISNIDVFPLYQIN